MVLFDRDAALLEKRIAAISISCFAPVSYTHLATQADLEESIEVVIAGYQKKNAILTDKEKWTVAYHEIGHAPVSYTHLCLH